MTGERAGRRKTSRRLRWAVQVALMGLAVAGICLWPALTAHVWWYLAVALLLPCLGSAILYCVQPLTGGRWLEGLEPTALRLAGWLPWAFLLLLPLALFPQCFAWWAQDLRPDLALKRGAFVSPWFFYLRSLACFAVFLGIALGIRRGLSPAMAGPALIILALTGFFFAVDWVMVREPAWSSTGFPFTFLVLSVVSAFAVSLHHSEPVRFSEKVRRDCATLLLATVLLTTYLELMAFIVVWMGNLPTEVGFYLVRSEGIDLVFLSGAIAGMAFLFVNLLQAGKKVNPSLLRRYAMIALLTAGLYLYWILRPHDGVAAGWTAPIWCVILGGAVLWYATRRPLPRGD